MPKTLTPKSKSKKQLVKEIAFEFYSPLAKDVYVAGTFNQWNRSEYDMKKTIDGKWQIKLALNPGRYEYRYLVDGNWENDQRPVACVPNAFGTWNCVVEVS